MLMHKSRNKFIDSQETFKTNRNVKNSFNKNLNNQTKPDESAKYSSKIIKLKKKKRVTEEINKIEISVDSINEIPSEPNYTQNDDEVIIDSYRNTNPDQQQKHSFISPREYDKVLEKYLVKSKESDNQAQRNYVSKSSLVKSSVCKESTTTNLILEKMAMTLDVKKTDEKEFVRNFFREYSTSPKIKAKSFTERMQEDIIKRRKKEDCLRQAEDQYRKNKYGSVNTDREIKIFDRLFKESYKSNKQSKIINYSADGHNLNPISSSVSPRNVAKGSK